MLIGRTRRTVRMCSLVININIKIPKRSCGHGRFNWPHPHSPIRFYFNRGGRDWKYSIAYSNILKILPPKNENFQIKILIFFQISPQNVDCGYSLEPPRQGGSNEYPQSMF